MSKGNKKTKAQKQQSKQQPNTQAEELTSLLKDAPQKRNVSAQQDVEKGDLVTTDGKKATVSVKSNDEEVIHHSDVEKAVDQERYIGVRTFESHNQPEGRTLRPDPDRTSVVNTESTIDQSDGITEDVQIQSFDSAVDDWLIECFGETIARDKVERNHRFLEESLELVQACGGSAAEAHKLVDYVFNRPRGEKRQEAGGTYITLLALCAAHDIKLLDVGSEELIRCHERIEEIREKQRNKPRFSALPQ